MVKKMLLTTCMVLGLVSCTAITDLLPSDFDNVEYQMLVELNVIAKSPLVKDDAWCHPSHISRMSYLSHQLTVYAKHRLNPNINKIYNTINDTVFELKQKEDPSNAYCKIKRNTIYKMTDDTMKVFGQRK